MTLSSLNLQRIQCQKQRQKLAAGPSIPLVSISRAPMAISSSSFPTTSLPIKRTDSTATVHDFLEDPRRDEAKRRLTFVAVSRRHSDAPRWTNQMWMDHLHEGSNKEGFQCCLNSDGFILLYMRAIQGHFGEKQS